jgi:hypothetical protein
MRALGITAVFLVAMAWRYRNNRPIFFVVVGTIFALAAILVSGSALPERILQSLALAWAACTLVAGVSGAWELAHYLRKKRKAIAPDGPVGN